MRCLPSWIRTSYYFGRTLAQKFHIKRRTKDPICQGMHAQIATVWQSMADARFPSKNDDRADIPHRHQVPFLNSHCCHGRVEPRPFSQSLRWVKPQTGDRAIVWT
jgi:hypothetical protein